MTKFNFRINEYIVMAQYINRSKTIHFNYNKKSNKCVSFSVKQ